jgi:hypothetical protein
MFTDYFGPIPTIMSMSLLCSLGGGNENIDLRVWMMLNVDVSKLLYGLNDVLYFPEIAGSGGLVKYPGNKTRAKCGTYYYDSQCSRIRLRRGKSQYFSLT